MKMTTENNSVQHRRLKDPLYDQRRVFGLVCLLFGMLFSPRVSFAIEVGDTLPGLSFPQLVEGQAGDSVSLASFRGRLIYLDVWASWCAPCRQSMPILDQWRTEFSQRGFEVVAVNVDEQLPDALKFLRKTPVSYPVLLDPKAKLPRKFSLVGMPTSYLIGPDGVVLYKHTGFKKSDIEEIRTTIESFLPE
ncbi:MAG: TlpA disulfide reductase family protein [Pseudomonadota bacterium]